MEIRLEIWDKLYGDVSRRCAEIGMTLEDYVVEAVKDKFYTEKYGDLNEIMSKKEEKKEEKPKESPKPAVEELKPSIEKLNPPEEKPNPRKVAKKAEENPPTVEMEHEKEERTEEEEIPKPPKKVKRTLKAR